MVESLGSTQVVVSVLALVVTIGLAITGWKKQHESALLLQRKQLAISILGNSAFQETWVKAMDVVFNKIRSDSQYDWSILATKRFNDGNDMDQLENELYHSLKLVLNHFEFISIAVLNEAVDRDIVKWSRQYQMDTVYDHCKPFIDKLRKLSKDQDLLVNFTEFVESWRPKGSCAKPT